MAEAKKSTEAKDKKEAELVVEATPVKPAKKPARVKAEKPAVVDAVEEPKVLAKAGKRSAKAVAEIEEKEVKEARKAEADTTEAKAKPAAKPPRSKAERAGKKYREAAKLIDKTKAYSIAEAAELAVKTSPVKFDATVELHLNLGVDPKQADQNVRGTLSLPAGTGKNVRVAVFAEPDDAKKASAAGADIAGVEAVTTLLDKESLDFDILIATPKMMPQLGKYARLLGPRGLMPNPKSGTVTADVVTAVKEAKAGRVEYRVDPSGIVHLGIGKVSFGPEKLAQNIEAILSHVRSNKPASIKGNYILGIWLTTTMGPSIRLSTS